MAFSRALGVVAWPSDKNQIRCAALAVDQSQGTGAADGSKISINDSSCTRCDTVTVTDCAFLRFKSEVAATLPASTECDVLAAANKTNVDLFAIGAVRGDDGITKVNIIKRVSLKLPNDIGIISSLAWRPIERAELLVVTRTCAFLYKLNVSDLVPDKPMRLQVPVTGSLTHAAFSSHLAMCGGGEFSLHSLDSVKTDEATCLCADLATGAPRVHLGPPQSLQYLPLATHDPGTGDIFVSLTDSPVALPFASGKRDRPLNEALHMMKAARSKRKESTTEMPSHKSATLEAKLDNAAKPKSIISTGASKNDSEDGVIDLIGGFKTAHKSGRPSGRPGGALGNLMSIGAQSVDHSHALTVVSVLDGDKGSKVRRQLDGNTKTNPGPCLSVYRLARSKDGEYKSVMRVAVCHVPLVNGDIMSICRDTGLLAVGSGTCGDICVFKVFNQDKIKMVKKLDLAKVVNPAHHAGESDRAGKGASPSSKIMARVRCKGLSFSNGRLFVLAGVKLYSGPGFFSAGTAQFTCEVRSFFFNFSRDLCKPDPKNTPKSSISTTTRDSNAIMTAILDMKAHMDARMDRIEGSLLMHSQRLERIEHALLQF